MERGKSVIIFVLALAAAAVALFGCAGMRLVAAEVLGLSTGREQRKVSKDLGVDVLDAEVISSEDSHGGFHGDGMTFVVLHFDEDGLAEQLEGLAGWHPLPLSENAGILIYGYDTEKMKTGPYLCDEQGQGMIPQIQNGYYYFYDRHSESRDVYDDTYIFDRGSYNFTLAIYDADSGMLYYAKLDT